ncbi:MAG TPA: PQQ-dependent sugar dehydrogenase [Thermoanaerobaculia bacterium]|nr:PQQ-dependent sugar dehydrogenase [Thermoanaerobaculia bacterium]
MKRLLLLLPFLASLPLLGATPRVALRTVVTGLGSPVAITSPGDRSGRLFITEQRGTIRVVDRGSLVQTPFLDVSTLVSCCGERGLLSVAFHPRYAENGFFYIDYTDRNGDTVIARYSVSPTDDDVASPSSALVLLKIAQPYSNHNGGQLQFGPDGYLYIGMGDGGSGGDPGNRAQDLSTLLGKLLRIDVDAASPYAIPSSNPFVGNSSARGEIWALGLRNPWRFSFDRQNTDLWIGDVGQNAWEEIDLQRVGSIGGENYGWRLMEGTHCYNPSSNCDNGGITRPVLEYSHAQGCSVTGGYRYRGLRYPNLQGMYLYADYCSGTLWGALPDAQGRWSATVLLQTAKTVSTFGEDEDGEVYLADYSGGVIYQIVDQVILRKRAARR